MAVEFGNKVMVAIDENECSYYALIWVLQNLKETITKSGNPLTIFMVLPRPTNSIAFGSSLGPGRMYCNVFPTPEFVSSVQEQNYKVCLGILEKAKSICTSHGSVSRLLKVRRIVQRCKADQVELINAEIITEIGDARDTICNAVEKYKTSLLVLGDHEIGKIKRALLGSVSNYCVHNAKCPVLVVKKPE